MKWGGARIILPSNKAPPNHTTINGVYYTKYLFYHTKLFIQAPYFTTHMAKSNKGNEEEFIARIRSTATSKRITIPADLIKKHDIQKGYYLFKILTTPIIDKINHNSNDNLASDNAMTPGSDRARNNTSNIASVGNQGVGFDNVNNVSKKPTEATKQHFTISGQNKEQD